MIQSQILCIRRSLNAYGTFVFCSFVSVEDHESGNFFNAECLHAFLSNLATASGIKVDRFMKFGRESFVEGCDGGGRSE
jgi:hypothetical protein